jgi:hypothetical protein
MGTSEWNATIDDVPVVERELRLVLNEMVLVLVIVIGARVVGRTNARNQRPGGRDYVRDYSARARVPPKVEYE